MFIVYTLSSKTETKEISTKIIPWSSFPIECSLRIEFEASKVPRWFGLTWCDIDGIFQDGHSFNGWPSLAGWLATKDRLRAWGLVNDNFCVLCHGGLESHSQLFFECSFIYFCYLGGCES